MQPKIIVRGLHKTFYNRRTGREVVALEDIDLDIAEGEFVCIVGPSGCGKSTLLNILAGFEEPTRGSTEIRGLYEAAVATSMVFQEHALFPWRTVLENVAFGPEMRGVPSDQRREAASRYIAMVGLDQFKNSYPHELSGGMRQRVALARALANEPEVLLMDEPFASLDAQTKRILQEEFLQLLSGRTVVYITHAIEEAVFLGDRVVIMTKQPGRVKETHVLRPEDKHSEQSLANVREKVWNSLRQEIPSL